MTEAKIDAKVAVMGGWAIIASTVAPNLKLEDLNTLQIGLYVFAGVCMITATVLVFRDDAKKAWADVRSCFLPTHFPTFIRAEPFLAEQTNGDYTLDVEISNDNSQRIYVENVIIRLVRQRGGEYIHNQESASGSIGWLAPHQHLYLQFRWNLRAQDAGVELLVEKTAIYVRGRFRSNKLLGNGTYLTQRINVKGDTE